MKKLIFIMLALVCFTACTNDDENGLEITGDWDDNIGLSTKSVTLNGAGEPVTIKTEGKNWWIATIKVDGEILYNFIEDGTENRNMYQTGLFNLKCGWLKVNVEDWTLSISADMNHGAERTFKITLESRHYFDHLDGNQAAPLTRTATAINLSPTSVTLPAGGGTLYCTTNEECTDWKIFDITIDDKNYKCTLNEWIDWSYTSTFEKTCEWLTVKRDNDKLYVTAEPNTTGKERIFTVRLFADDMHDVLNGTQPAE